MCKVIAIPAKSLQQIEDFIRKESQVGHCVLCGKDVERKSDDEVAVCESCARECNRVRCARCGKSYTIMVTAKEVHEGIADLSFLNLDENTGPIGIVVGACRDERCDKEGLLKEVPYRNLEWK